MTTLKQTPASQILAVDFVAKQLIGSDCRPMRMVWKCNVCDTKYTHIDGSDTNMPFMKVPHTVKIGTKEYDVGIQICRDCWIQIGQMFAEEN